MATLAVPSIANARNMRVLGHLPEFRADPLLFLERMARTHGDVVQYRLGPQRTYLLSNPDHIRDVLVTHQGNFTKSRVLQRLKPLLGEGLLTSEGDFHLRQRRLAQPAFHRERLVGYSKTMTEFALETRERWEAGDTIDIDAEMMRLTLAIVAKTLFSTAVEAETEEIGESLTTIMMLFRVLMLPGSKILTWLPTSVGRRFRKARGRLDRTIYAMIDERRKSGGDRGDLLSMLMMAQDEEGTGSMSDQQVRDEAMTLFLAGHETTANALTWTWYLLSQNPECETAMHEEIDSVLAGRAPGFEDLPKLRYTEMVLAESMRIFPPVWSVGRMAKKDYPIAGATIPAGSVLMMSPWVVHRDSRFYPDALRFDPLRWTPEAKEQRPKFAYFPFGGGSRLCIGERFAWMEGVLLLATIAQQWKFRLSPGHPVEPMPLITLRPRHGMKMTVEAR
jgi:cytochrome P450